MNTSSPIMTVQYTVRTVSARPSLDQGPDCSAWRNADTATLTHFRPEGSTHRPSATAKLLHDNDTIYGLFQVQDRYVRSRHREYMSPVCADSCVEFFFAPHPNSGYFNFEFNCGGTLLASHIVDPTRTPHGFREWTPLAPADAALITICHALPDVVDPEIVDPVDWWLSFSIPMSLLETYAGKVLPLSGKACRGNFYKCGDHTSHPHWASWSPVRELNFHAPACFGELQFL